MKRFAVRFRRAGAMIVAPTVVAACASSKPPPRAPVVDVAAGEVPPLPPPDPAAMPKRSAVVLRAARLFDGKGDRELEGGVAVAFEDGLITAVGAASAVQPPAGAEVIDLGDATLMPGMIDAHTHVTHEQSPNYYKDIVDDYLRPPAEQAFYAASYARTLLDAGYTTIRDVGSSHYVDIGLRNAIAAGLVPGPRILAAGYPIGARGGHMDAPPFDAHAIPMQGVDEGICTGVDACTEAVRIQVKYGADVIKIGASGGVLSLTDAVDVPQLSRAELGAIVSEAHRLRRKVAAHCHGDTAAKEAVLAGVDSIEHGTFLKPDTLALMKSKGAVLVPTLLASDWLEGHSEHHPPAIKEKIRAAIAGRDRMFKDALRSGVTIAMGTDSGVSPHGINARELVLMTKLGMSNAAALRATTSVDAKLLGIDAQTGTLEKGKLADVIAVPGDPLKDISVTAHVMLVVRAGEVVKRPAPAAATATK